MFLDPLGFPLEEGDLVRRPRLTKTLETIAKEGPDAFYNGTLAQDIVADLNECGEGEKNLGGGRERGMWECWK